MFPSAVWTVFASHPRKMQETAVADSVLWRMLCFERKVARAHLRRYADVDEADTLQPFRPTSR
ncbi:hypothetical protein BN2476_680072 [Paraburkholderia piptadeniae]|uniref:Uncharacterized protein n=1 Tax=Paraburkholderia piptadeniae TaxID=1701573 RepID=A0A1N7SQV1_9BURK|nr:hypothetical protein BN2476_680072 [Paraburkholderia piptadeniae]